ncbi:HNH endonuclease signature motif containing protein [Klebsiella variicola]|uniref:HNH endonuclease signature motif containing protein n=1 Tax=Klebsiella variicola TaxID=244366 RepID=UPI000D74A027|nr:hypothetical protein DMT41_09190 [Klebsiella variicola]PXK61442.1 hypothetical protein DMR84_00665 [Klebsiella variicola]
MTKCNSLPASTESRLLSKVEKDLETGCWIFTGSRLPSGYGILWNGARPTGAHRISFQLYKGEIPAGKEIDHICNNRSCVNPAHLQAISHKENIHKSSTLMGVNARKSHCKRGHPLNGENLHITPLGARQCKECMRMHARNAKARKRDARNRN